MNHLRAEGLDFILKKSKTQKLSMLEIQMIIRSAVTFLQKNYGGKINKVIRTRCAEELHKLLPHVDQKFITEKLTIRYHNVKRNRSSRKKPADSGATAIDDTDDGGYVPEYELDSFEMLHEEYEEAEDFENTIDTHSIHVPVKK